jgi:prepilin-type processing-associated H-X9-DG protein
MSNMRQIGIAMNLYANENQGWLPTTTHGANQQNSWIYQLEEYLGNQFEECRICPADPRGQERLHANGTSYILNEFTAVDLTNPFGQLLETYRHRVRMEKPSDTVIMFTVSDEVGASVMNDHTHSRRWNNWNAVTDDIQPDRFGNGASDHSEGSANYLYADGRVENIRAAQVKSWIDSGINFAAPPEIRQQL